MADLHQPMKRGDVGMIQGRENPGFALEAVAPFLIAREEIRQYLECNLASEPAILGAIHLPHTPCAEDGQNLYGQESCPA